MKKIVFLILFMCFSIFAKEKDFYVGIYLNNFFEDQRFSELVMKSMEQEFNARDNGFNIRFIVYKDEEKLIKDFKSNKIVLAVLAPYHFFNKEDKLLSSIKDIWTVRVGDARYEQYYLIKNKDSKATLKNISKYNINYKDGIYSSKLWFKSLIYKEYKKPYSEVIFNEVNLKKRYTLALKPFFSKKELSILTSYDYDLMIELNPQIKENTVILKKSKPIFFTVLGLTNKAMSKEDHDLINTKFKQNNNLLNEKNTFDLTLLSRVYILEKDEMKKIKSFFDEYRGLLKYEKK